MFKKRITPFACIIISLTVCLVTVIGVSAYRSVIEKERINEARLQASEYTDYADLIKAIGDDGTEHSKLAAIISMIERYYVYDYDENELWERIYTDIIKSLGDDYSQYITADEYKALIDSNDGDFVGIGVHATYDVDTQGIYIFGVIPQSPAEKAGLKKGDIVIASEGIEASEENYYELLDSIRGEKGSYVEMTILRGEEKIEFKVERDAVASESVIYEKLGTDTAYIQILTFSDTTVSEQFTKIIALAQSESCDKFIFDVRNNLGGDLEEICAILDLLLPEGPIINIIDKDGNIKTRNSDANCIKGKMTVLCNGSTASAAELFTAALRDYDLATIIGTKTFGKGSMQTTRLLPDGSAVKLSGALYNPPSNVSYNKIGITPDEVITLPEEWESRFFKMPHEEDTQLQKAIEILNTTK